MAPVPDIELFDSRISTHERSLDSLIQSVRSVRLYWTSSWHWNSTWRDGRKQGPFLNLKAAVRTVESSRSPGLNHGILEMAALALQVSAEEALVVADSWCSVIDALGSVPIRPKCGVCLRDVAGQLLNDNRPYRFYRCYVANARALADLGPDLLSDHWAEAIPGGRYRLKWHKRDSTRTAERVRELEANSRRDDPPNEEVK